MRTPKNAGRGGWLSSVCDATDVEGAAGWPGPCAVVAAATPLGLGLAADGLAASVGVGLTGGDVGGAAVGGGEGEGTATGGTVAAGGGSVAAGVGGGGGAVGCGAVGVGAGVRGTVGAGVGAPPETTTVPVMNEWITQW